MRPLFSHDDRNLHRLMAGLLMLVPGIFSYSIPAGAVCVFAGDTQALENAMAAASMPNAPAATIKLEQGSYVDFNDAPYYFKTNVTIVGGYIPGTSCDEAQRQDGAGKTIFLYTDDSQGLNLSSDDDFVLKIRNVTIDGGNVFTAFADIVEINNVRVTHIDINPISIGTYGASSSIKMTNVQFDHLTGQEECSIYIVLDGHASAFINHMTADISGGRDLCLDDGQLNDGSKHIDIWNSIVWDFSNSGAVIATRHEGSNAYPITVSLLNVDYSGISHLPSDPVLFDPNYPSIQLDPLWSNPLAGDYSLSNGPNSPVVNAGTALTPGGEPFTDITGADRYVGSAPDMGAHESPYNDFAGGNVFNVTNTNDVADVNSPLYPGSLRWAITQSNAQSGNSLIQFLLPTCPSVILLNSPLPSIWVPLTINGYSAPGSSVNTATGDFSNAHLCVAIQPANTSITPSALMVPSGASLTSLVVKGLGFGSFSQAIQLWGGHDHQIVGNQFGGVMNGVQLFGFDVDAIRVEMTGPVLIGGSSAADRNVFLNAGFGADAAAVLVGFFTDNTQPVCQIVGNLFGITPDGFSADPNNQYGIKLLGNGCSVLRNRMAGNIKDAIHLAGGHNHVIQSNVIGPAMFFGQDFNNPGAGIRIAGGSSNNVIGAGPGVFGSPGYFANTIVDMDKGGVIVESGTGNAIRGNLIKQNGLSTGVNLDLGDNGATPNDAGDVDTGGNGLQNYPMPHGLHWSNGTPAPGSINNAAMVNGILGTASGFYQIDAYYDQACSTNRRGGGLWVGSLDFVYVPPGIAPISFSVPVTIPNYDSVNGKVSITATLNANGDYSTSEFSTCLSVDTIFSDGMGAE